MKILSLFFVISLVVYACSGDDNNRTQNQSIIGTWKLIEILVGDGSGYPQWREVEDSYQYTFKGNGVLLSDRFSCEGTYIKSSDKLFLGFECEDRTFAGNQEYSIEDNELILTPTEYACDEGCSSKFIKTSNN